MYKKYAIYGRRNGETRIELNRTRFERRAIVRRRKIYGPSLSPSVQAAATLDQLLQIQAEWKAVP